MHFGSICVMDALGFKGIWRRRKYDDVVGALQRAKSLAPAYIAVHDDFSKSMHDHDPLKKVRLITRFWSDTIVIAAFSTEDLSKYMNAGAVRQMVGKYTTSMICNAAVIFQGQSMVPHGAHLPYRGAIACGDLFIDDDFIIGPAVDEAAEHAEVADAAIVALLPSAETGGVWIDKMKKVAFPWDVPLKSGTTRKALCINPLAYASADEGKAMVDRILVQFVGDDGVMRKKANTEAFLNAALAVS
jgi:hypothetical protein